MYYTHLDYIAKELLSLFSTDINIITTVLCIILSLKGELWHASSEKKKEP